MINSSYTLDRIFLAIRYLRASARFLRGVYRQKNEGMAIQYIRYHQ